MRQTNLTLDEILKQLNDKKQHVYPACMLLNEIGVMCTEQKDEEAEKSLLSFLESPEPGFRAISFCFLFCDKEMQSKHHLLLSEFRAKPENQILNEDINDMIIRFES